MSRFTIYGDDQGLDTAHRFLVRIQQNPECINERNVYRKQICKSILTLGLGKLLKKLI